MAYPSQAELLRTLWRFYHVDGQIAAEGLRLMPDGRISGYNHANEAFWQMRGGMLEFLSSARAVSTRFDTVERDGERLARITGRFLLDPKLNITLALEPRDFASLPKFEPTTKSRLKDQIAHNSWEIGDHTYGLPLIYASGPEKLKIGRFTAIGGSVTIVLANHNPAYASTYPFALHRDFWPGVPHGIRDHTSKGDVTIGSDVWIGHGVFIGSGVNVGDGAVLGAQAVVLKDVPPYGIVAGNPARLIRYRFAVDVIEALLSMRWWDWPDEKVDSFLPLILSEDVRGFIEAVKHHDGGSVDASSGALKRDASLF